MSASRIGVFLTRIVVPSWVMMGAAFKLYERVPSDLPSQVWRTANTWGVDLYVLLATLIFLELLAAIAMVLSSRLARPVAVMVLTVFCLVLLNEMRVGNFESCGCLGNLPIATWQMLVVDAVFLASVLICRPRAAVTTSRTRGKPILAIVLIVLGAVLSFGIVLPERRTIVTKVDVSPESLDLPKEPKLVVENPAPIVAPVQVDPKVNSNPIPLPSYFISDGFSSWIGKPWRQLEIFRLMPIWPRDMDQGKHHVIFYNRTCKHCETMFRNDLTGPIGRMVTAVEIPANRREMRADNAWELPPTECELLELPVGTLWVIVPPLTITVENGLVTCVKERDYKSCLDKK